jgi:TolA-binding protein
VTLTRVGQAAASIEEYSVALSALMLASHPDAPESAKPLVIAAMILDERLRDHGGAKRIYEQVVQRFPGTQAAEKARRELADPRFILEGKTG